jgi:hypothetical protein
LLFYIYSLQRKTSGMGVVAEPLLMTSSKQNLPVSFFEYILAGAHSKTTRQDDLNMLL